jgi:hypothetical protein
MSREAYGESDDQIPFVPTGGYEINADLRAASQVRAEVS